MLHVVFSVIELALCVLLLIFSLSLMARVNRSVNNHVVCVISGIQPVTKEKACWQLA